VSFLSVPPFPGRSVREFARLPQTLEKQVSLAECLALVREKRVGGAFWAPQPGLPPSYLLVRSAAALSTCDSLVEQLGGVLLWLPAPAIASSEWPTVIGECDPWHMLSSARALVCDAGDEVRLVAAIIGVPTYLVDPQGGPPQLWDGDEDVLLAQALPVAASFSNPFTDDVMNLVELIELCGFWRSLIDANRSISCGVGFAFWKQESVLPLLWGGGESSAFFRNSAGENPNGAIALWRSKASSDVVERLDRRGTPVVEVEDGFLRSKGLGADCVPPLSITVDRLGPYFDPGQPSELENLLQDGCFEPTLTARARRLRETIVATGLGKYDRGDAILGRLDDTKHHILVAGQVEDDRSVLTGGSGLDSNLELLKRVRAREPDSYLIYKPHPDVVAGHRKGDIPEHICRQFADKVVTDAPISSLIAMVDEVHVNTSLAGFEALMRHKKVTTHGVPFYAGWGLTCDLGPVPARRTSKRTLDELVAATLLIYPRYLDPVTGLPCPAEVVVDRLTEPSLRRAGPLVRLRRLQGRWKRRLAALRIGPSR
jgi:capsular polysaccharide export protein